jgi:hypothetical protein
MHVVNPIWLASSSHVVVAFTPAFAPRLICIQRHPTHSSRILRRIHLFSYTDIRSDAQQLLYLRCDWIYMRRGAEIIYVSICATKYGTVSLLTLRIFLQGHIPVCATRVRRYTQCASAHPRRPHRHSHLRCIKRTVECAGVCERNVTKSRGCRIRNLPSIPDVSIVPNDQLRNHTSFASLVGFGFAFKN